MAETQNITLRMPVPLLRRLKRMAAARELSISALILQSLESIDGRAAEYEATRRTAMEHLRHPLPMGGKGRPTATRDELHER